MSNDGDAADQVDAEAAVITPEEVDVAYQSAVDADVHDIRLLRRFTEILPELRSVVGDENIIEPVQWRAQHAIGAVMDRIGRICAGDTFEVGD